MRVRKTSIIYLLLLFISIGFAVLTSNFGATGLASFAESSFNVYIDNVVEESSSVEGTTFNLDSSKTSLSISSSFDKPGDYIDISFYVVNDGTMDAVLDSFRVTGVNGTYFSSSLKYDIDSVAVSSNTSSAYNYILRAGQRRKINFHLEYKYDITEFYSGSSLDVTINMSYINPEKNSSTVWNYEYTGGEQYFIANKTGRYKLETWGAEGGKYKSEISGGYGGYATGTIVLDKNTKLYINVGGQGQDGAPRLLQFVNPKGGYNGGGNGGLSSPVYSGGNYSNGGGGGGATHIATSSGLLSSLESNKESIIIVAGGGGGTGMHTSTGIAGGGYVGGSSNHTGSCQKSSEDVFSSGGTQISGYAFGQGQNGKDKVLGGNCGAEGNGGGGGGYYGGTSFSDFDDSTVTFHSSNISGGGGSGYIGNPNLTDKIMYCYKCQSSENEEDETDIKTRVASDAKKTPTSKYAKKGHGYVRITYLGK